MAERILVIGNLVRAEYWTVHRYELVVRLEVATGVECPPPGGTCLYA
jgi:hypothetical protein